MALFWWFLCNFAIIFSVMNSFFAHTIEKWYEVNKRDLPWREIRDPYRIWISEIILQQTRVAQGYDYYVRFVKRFPNVESLASASEDEVLLMWQGLGYYSRARNLHKAAKFVVNQYATTDGKCVFPSTYDDIKQLPGVGEYTAAAIASFAFDEPKAVLDGNVFRVLSRYFGVDSPIDTTAGKREFRTLADEMLDKKHPALYNQAIMDFGAMVCTPHALCADCPLSDGCGAMAMGRVEQLPLKSRTLQIRRRNFVFFYVRAEGQILLHRRAAGDIWANMYEPLLIETDEDGMSAFSANILELQSRLPFLLGLGNEVKITLLKKGVRHQLTHRLLLSDFYVVDCESKHSVNEEWVHGNGYFWCDENDRDSHASSRLVQELYKSVNLHDENLLI